MPSSTEKQRKFMGAELARKRAGKKTRTGMTEEQLEEFASKPVSKSTKGSKSFNATEILQGYRLLETPPKF